VLVNDAKIYNFTSGIIAETELCDWFKHVI